MSTTTSSPGELVRKRREELELTRERLAVECKISSATLARLENYDRLPHTTILLRIAERLDMPIGELMAGAIPDTDDGNAA